LTTVSAIIAISDDNVRCPELPSHGGNHLNKRLLAAAPILAALPVTAVLASSGSVAYQSAKPMTVQVRLDTARPANNCGGDGSRIGVQKAAPSQASVKLAAERQETSGLNFNLKPGAIVEHPNSIVVSVCG
jgi:hypothetical protein